LRSCKGVRVRKVVVGEKEENEERGVSEKKAGDGNGRREKRRKVLVFMLHIGALLAMEAFPKRRFSSRHAVAWFLFLDVIIEPTPFFVFLVLSSRSHWAAHLR